MTTIDISTADASSSKLDGPPWVWRGPLALVPFAPPGVKFTCGLKS